MSTVELTSTEIRTRLAELDKLEAEHSSRDLEVVQLERTPR